MILACPTCDSRYDVTGYPAGQQFRCRCGTVTTLHAESPSAGLLACPQCGAGVAPSSSSCAYCSAELLLKTCPRCVARVFHGHKHCPECGAGLEQAATGQLTQLPCPRCDKPLLARRVGDVVVDECGGCQGLFLDDVAVKRIVTDRAQARAEALLGTLPRHPVSMLPPPGGRMYLKCPQCRTVMNRKQFATGAGVIIDVCKSHGTFFDVGELPAVIDFVMNGGLERAQRADMERVVDEARHAADSARFSAMMATRSSTSSFGGYGDTRIREGAALIDFLTHVFR
jgi:Zn-finger nucleic acid-binding protein